VRTTVTLDPDVEALLKDEVHRTRRSFKTVLNDALREQLKPLASPQEEPFIVEARPMGLRTGVDPARITELGDDLELEAFLATTKKLKEKMPTP